MKTKLYLPANIKVIKGKIKELGMTRKDIEEMSDGNITETDLKNILNKGVRVDEETLSLLSSLLKCPKVELIDRDYFLSLNLSYEINSIVALLYLKNKEDINRFYSSQIKKFRTSFDLAKILDQADTLYLILSEEDYIFDKSSFLKGFDKLCNEYTLESCICNYNIIGLKRDEVKDLFHKIRDSSGEYKPQQVLLMFIYVYIIFKAIFTEEIIASAIQLVPERKTDKADQYFELAYKSEKMQDTLIDYILYKDIEWDYSRIIENEIDELILEGIMLMLAACEKCYLHIHSDFVDSEYLNRASLSAIFTKLEKIFIEVGINIPTGDSYTKFVDLNNTRFGRLYIPLKEYFRGCNPSQQRKNKVFTMEDFYLLNWMNKGK